jgi:hypothetical protein
MKKQRIIQLALVGLTHGLLINATVEAHEQTTSSYAHDSRYAKAGCPGPGGCPSPSKKTAVKTTAARDMPEGGPKLLDPSKVDSSASSSSSYSSDSDPNSGNLGYHLMTEDELMLELNDSGVKQFQSLSPEGKALALKLASQRCNASNSCKGQNACKTDNNDCAGKGDCKGKSKCAFSDKNLAVQIASKLMAEKRTQSLKGK